MSTSVMSATAGLAVAHEDASRARSGVTWLPVALLAFGVVAAAASAAAGDVLVGLAGGCASFTAIALGHLVGYRGLAAAVLLFLVSPGVLGESSLLLSLAALTAILLVAATYPAEQSPPAAFGLVSAIVVLALVAIGLATAPGGLMVSAAYVLAAGVVVVSWPRVAFIRETFRGVTLILAGFVASYAITFVLGFTSSLLTALTIQTRHLELYFPLTVTAFGPPFLEGTRRMVPGVGEPGLAIYFLLPLAALALAPGVRTSRRVWLLGLVAATALFSQAAGTILALAAGASTYLVYVLVARRHVFAASAAVVSAALATHALFSTLISFKRQHASISLSDRGLPGVGHRSSSEGINVISSLHYEPALGLALAVAVAVLVLVGCTSAGGLALVTAFGVTAVAAQPSQWQIGAWLLILMCLRLLEPSRRSAADRPDDGRTDHSTRPYSLRT